MSHIPEGKSLDEKYTIREILNILGIDHKKQQENYRKYYTSSVGKLSDIRQYQKTWKAPPGVTPCYIPVEDYVSFAIHTKLTKREGKHFKPVEYILGVTKTDEDYAISVPCNASAFDRLKQSPYCKRIGAGTAGIQFINQIFGGKPKLMKVGDLLDDGPVEEDPHPFKEYMSKEQLYDQDPEGYLKRNKGVVPKGRIQAEEERLKTPKLREDIRSAARDQGVNFEKLQEMNKKEAIEKIKGLREKLEQQQAEAQEKVNSIKDPKEKASAMHKYLRDCKLEEDKLDWAEKAQRRRGEERYSDRMDDSD